MSTTIITPKFRASYVTLFEARANSKDKPDEKSFSITALFPADPEVPKGSVTLKAMQELALKVAFDKWGDTPETRKRIKAGKIKMPFITGDRLESDIEEGKVPEGTKVMMRFKSAEKYRPGVVDRYRGPDGKAAVITEPEVLYSGCYARAEVKAIAYDRADSKGVTFVLNNVQKLDEGEPLGGVRRKAEDTFDAFDDEPPAVGTSGAASVETEDDDPMGLLDD